MHDKGGWLLDEIFPGSKIYQLKSSSSGKTIINGFAAKKSNREAAAKLVSTLNMIQVAGISRSVENTTIRRVDGSIVEVRVRGTVIRAFSYQRNGDDCLVVLDIQRTHQGAGSIRRHIDAVKEKANAAKELLEATKGDGHGQGL